MQMIYLICEGTSDEGYSVNRAFLDKTRAEQELAKLAQEEGMTWNESRRTWFDNQEVDFMFLEKIKIE